VLSVPQMLLKAGESGNACFPHPRPLCPSLLVSLPKGERKHLPPFSLREKGRGRGTERGDIGDKKLFQLLAGYLSMEQMK